MRRQFSRLAVAALLFVVLIPPAGADEVYEFEAPVYDLTATPDGSILVGEFRTIKEIRKGEVSEVAEMPTDLEPGDINNASVAGTVNGLDANGRRSFFATRTAPDLAIEAGVFHFSNGGWRLVGDIEEFEHRRDPDAFEGPMWKDQACEFDLSQGFSAGPQSNPYHLTTISGSESLVADAAGNTVLAVKANGQPVELVAILTPPLNASGEYMEFFDLAGGITCYVQPVATAVTVGSDGAYYISELTGATPGFPFETGLSRIWRVEAGARNAVCSEITEDATGSCELFADGFTSIIDVETGPDGKLYVVEYDEGGWISAFARAFSLGGTISACDLGGSCDVVAEDLEFPSAITFDKRSNLWLLENNTSTPTVRILDLP